MTTATQTIEQLANKEYKWGFVSDIESESIPKGLSEDVVRLISAKKNEPAWLLDWRLKAYRYWTTMEEPRWWPNVTFPPVEYQNMIYYAAPKPKKKLTSLDEVDPEMLKTFEKLGISLDEQKRLIRVPVMCVVRCELVIPFHHTGFRIQSDHAVRIEIVALAIRAVEVGAGIADAPVEKVELRIVGAAHPRGAAGVLDGAADPR